MRKLISIGVIFALFLFQLGAVKLELPISKIVVSFPTGHGLSGLGFRDAYIDYYGTDLQIDKWGTFWFVDSPNGLLARFSTSGIMNKLIRADFSNIIVRNDFLIGYEWSGSSYSAAVFKISKLGIELVARQKISSQNGESLNNIFIINENLVCTGRDTVVAFRITSQGLVALRLEELGVLESEGKGLFSDKYAIFETNFENWLQSQGLAPDANRFFATTADGTLDRYGVARGFIFGKDNEGNTYVVNHRTNCKRVGIVDSRGGLIRMINIEPIGNAGAISSTPCLDGNGNIFYLEMSQNGHKLIEIVHDSVIASERVFFVNDEKVRIRESPSTDGKVLTQVGRGTKLRYLGESKNRMTIGGLTAEWKKVRTAEGIEGWIFGAFVQEKPL